MNACKYYEHAGITIWHGDCREVLTLVEADCFLTDPPWGLNGGRGGDAKAFRKAKYDSRGWTDTEDYISTCVVPVIETLAAKFNRGAVTPGVRCMMLYPKPADIGCFFHPASPTHGPWGMVAFSPILYYGRDPYAGIGSHPTGRSVTEISDKLGHPCAKPIGAWTWLLSKITSDATSVIDPFCGSGVTLRAAKNLGIQAIGIEIEERYCEIAAKRLEQEVLPLTYNGEHDQQRLHTTPGLRLG